MGLINTLKILSILLRNFFNLKIGLARPDVYSKEYNDKRHQKHTTHSSRSQIFGVIIDPLPVMTYISINSRIIG